MSRPPRTPITLDQTAFAAYLLGAVVPLLLLAYVTERFALPALADRSAWLGLIGIVCSSAALSLGSFLALRRTMRRSLGRTEADNRRLQALLRVSSSLVGAQDQGDAARLAATCALDVAGAEAAFVMLADEVEPHPVLSESAGDNPSEFYEAEGRALTELASLVMDEGRPAVRGAGEVAAAGEGEKGVGPAAVVPIPGRNGALGALAVLQRAGSQPFDAAQVDTLSTLAALTSVSLRNADLHHAQRNFFSHVTEILVNALDSYLDYHRGHGNRVAQIANRLGRELGLDEESMQRLHFGALLHDIGMLKMDRATKMSPRSCERHTVLGARMLAHIRLWQDIAPIVHHHHERWDGSGYPDGVAREEIPIESRVIALADAFDSMVSDSSYKLAMSLEEAVREVETGAGSQFDPQIVRVFHRLVEREELPIEG